MEKVKLMLSTCHSRKKEVRKGGKDKNNKCEFLVKKGPVCLTYFKRMLVSSHKISLDNQINLLNVCKELLL